MLDSLRYYFRDLSLFRRYSDPESELLLQEVYFFFAELCSPTHTGETHATSPSICTTRR